MKRPYDRTLYVSAMVINALGAFAALWWGYQAHTPLTGVLTALINVVAGALLTAAYRARR